MKICCSGNLHRPAETSPVVIFIDPQINGIMDGEMFTYSMRKIPSISVQLTATSAMGILKHWAMYRSSTSKALREKIEKGITGVALQSATKKHCNGSVTRAFSYNMKCSQISCDSSINNPSGLFLQHQGRWEQLQMYEPAQHTTQRDTQGLSWRTMRTSAPRGERRRSGGRPRGWRAWSRTACPWSPARRRTTPGSETRTSGMCGRKTATANRTITFHNFIVVYVHDTLFSGQVHRGKHIV